MADQVKINLSRIERNTLHIPIIGTSPLIVHRWSQKARAELLAPQVTKTRAKKELRDMQAEYEGSLYRFDDGRYGFPSVAFKSAIVAAARLFDGVTMTTLRPALFVNGEGPERLVELNGEPRLREDIVRVGGKGSGTGTAMTRWRGEFTIWSATLEIVYLPTVLDADSVIALVDASGVSGVGEWRPGKSDTGSFGTYQLNAAEEVREYAA